ncbi:FAD-dependent oxidoreductase [Nonomuraea sp. NPDC003709]|uniref:FAD-dependent oxidoreductase n=1 Tax=Nonomuraea sp. NPDC003709 TaxID=3154450 RepID=UPI0033A8928D
MTFDVLVAGAGPVGLFLASELRTFGLNPLVLESAQPEGQWATDPRGFTVQGNRGMNERTIRTLALRGITETDLINVSGQAQRHLNALSGMLSADTSTMGAQFQALLADIGKNRKRVLGHFAALSIVADKGELGDRKGPLVVQQEDLLDLLYAHARAAGVTIRHGATVASVENTADGARVVLEDGERIEARWVVGCDGGRSNVRKSTGIPFTGTDPTMVTRAAVVELDAPSALPNGVTATERGLLMVTPYPGSIRVMESSTEELDRRATVSREEFQNSLRRVSGTDVTVTSISNAYRYTDHARQADTYRHGRILLAGDAAHVHPPVGGQGLNLGLQDAANLGWKLALVVRGLAPETLLDTYTTERHPPAALVLRNSRAQSVLFRPDAQSQALREVFAEVLNLTEAKAYFADMVASALVDYGHADGQHPQVGRFSPVFDVYGHDAEHASTPTHQGLLITASEDAELAGALDGWRNRVTPVTLSSHTGLDTPHALLVRPDGYIAWATDHPHSDIDGLRLALTNWFGAPVQPQHA